MILIIIALLLQLLSSTAGADQVHTGFNYGAYWTKTDNPKRKWEWVKLFNTAYNLNTSVPFDSARLFTCRQPGTTDTWIEAFDAAVETKTYLLLGFYLSEIKPWARKPSETYETNEQMLHWEIRALEKALEKYGSKLGDLIIGLSVGNEDLEQWYAQSEYGVPEDVIKKDLELVRKVVNGEKVWDRKFSNINKYLSKTPIGHTDTAPHNAKVPDVDFIGMNVDPYWSRDPIAVAKQSYFGSLNNVRQALPGKGVYLTEVGWPFEDKRSPVALQGTANQESMQKYWNDVGCSIFGKFTTFWFEMTHDTRWDQHEWAVLNIAKVPRIDLSCGVGRKWWSNGNTRRDIPAPVTSSIAATSASPSTTLTSSSTSEFTPFPSNATHTPPSQQIYTGFSYGAFWSKSEPKRYRDFLRQFKLARDLPGVPVPFTSARLYQTSQWGSPTEPTEAFQAAIDTNTTLLLGLWLPIDNELVALDEAFKKHGQRLADLVIGISVGNEDIYRGSDECTQKENRTCPMSATVEEVTGNITHVKSWIQQQPWISLFATPPPIGHADTARNAALKNADFAGSNIFPFWHPDPIDQAWPSFQESVQGIQQRASDVPVWITETGWPSSGDDVATVSRESMEKYWKDVGCALFGRYTTFWFELEKDTHDADDLDWGVIDIPSQKPKIDLRCPGPSVLPTPSGNATSSAGMPASSTGTLYSTVKPPASSSGLPTSDATTPAFGTTEQLSVSSAAPSTIHITITSTITVAPSPPAPPSPPPSTKPTITITEATGCITVSPSAGTYITLASHPPVNGTCPPPTYIPPSPSALSTKSTVAIAEATGCITVSQNSVGQFVTVAENPPVNGTCATPVWTGEGVR